MRGGMLNGEKCIHIFRVRSRKLNIACYCETLLVDCGLLGCENV
jgi:hypothetical protein